MSPLMALFASFVHEARSHSSEKHAPLQGAVRKQLTSGRKLFLCTPLLLEVPPPLAHAWLPEVAPMVHLLIFFTCYRV